MSLHELSKGLCKKWGVRVEGEEYGTRVRQWFQNECPYCAGTLVGRQPVIEHLDGMNRYRAGLHVPGNVLVACRTCNGEKRRDDSAKVLTLASSGWASFLSHDGKRCSTTCKTCIYWRGVWPEDRERSERLSHSAERIQSFRDQFAQFTQFTPEIDRVLPSILTELYSDCQKFAQSEIAALLARVEKLSASNG